MPLHVLSTCAHRQEVKIVLYSLWYHHTYKWPSRAHVERGLQFSSNLIIQLLQLKLYNHQERIPYFEKLHVVK